MTTKMWISRVSREEFLELMGAIEVRNRPDWLKVQELSYDFSFDGKLILLWETNPYTWKPSNIRFPVALIADDDQIDDLVAWLATFLLTFRPFTSVIRVLSSTEFRHCIDVAETADLGDLESACIGAIYGEALSQIDGPRPLTALDTFSTYSFAVSRSLSIYSDESIALKVGQRWFSTLNDLRPRRTKYLIEDLSRIWTVLLRIGSFTIDPGKDLQDVVDACRQVNDSGTIEDSLLDRLTGNLHDPIVYKKLRTERKELRVRLFSEMASRINADPFTASFVLGYFGSCLGNGSLSHVDLVSSQRKRFPQILMWYSVLVALRTKARLGADYSNLGRKLMIELQRPFDLLERPLADISYYESKVLRRSKSGFADVVEPSQSNLAIELYPGVTTVALSPLIEENALVSQNSSNTGIAYDDFELLGDKIKRLSHLYDDLSKRYKTSR